MRRLILSLVLAVVMVAGFALPALAGSSAGVSVTATPAYISITNAPDTWTINGLGSGSESSKGKINTGTTYYAKPVDGGDDIVPPGSPVAVGDCAFTVTNEVGSNVSVDLTVTWSDFTSGGAAMTNSNDGSNGADKYGAWCYYQGMNPYVTTKIVKSSGSAEMYSDGLAAAGTLKWGVAIITRTNDWTSSGNSTSTLTITATMH